VPSAVAASRRARGAVCYNADYGGRERHEIRRRGVSGIELRPRCLARSWHGSGPAC